MALRGRLDRLEKSAKPFPQDTHDPVAEKVCRLLSDRELQLIEDVLERDEDGAEEFPPTSFTAPEEKAAIGRFYKLYEEVSRGA
jgi:hypothetical protein